MAIIRLGPIVSGISGALGGLVFVSGKNGTVVRPRPQPIHKRGPFVLAARARLYNIRRHWSTLTTLQQDSWRAAAVDFNTSNALGLSSPIGGFQLFVKINAELRSPSDDIFDDPTSDLSGLPPRTVGAAFSAAGAFTAEAGPPFGFGTAIYRIYGWPFWVDHDTKSKVRLVFLKRKAAPSLSEDVRTEWETHFGTMVEGQRFALGVSAEVANQPRSQILVVRGTVAP